MVHAITYFYATDKIRNTRRPNITSAFNANYCDYRLSSETSGAMLSVAYELQAAVLVENEMKTKINK